MLSLCKLGNNAGIEHYGQACLSFDKPAQRAIAGASGTYFNAVDAFGEVAGIDRHDVVMTVHVGIGNINQPSHLIIYFYMKFLVN